MTLSARHEVRWLVQGGDNLTLDEQRAMAHKLLQQLVGCSCELTHDAMGAPLVVGHPALHVSVSHCRMAVAVAVSEKVEVGIDIECRRKVSRSLIERVCTADELAAIDASDDPVMTFLRYWTRKEAVLKCRRTGIRGFGSMLEASSPEDCMVEEIATGMDGVVAAVAYGRSTV